MSLKFSSIIDVMINKILQLYDFFKEYYIFYVRIRKCLREKNM